jgi:RNA polymerase sigma factor (sigma-70 family)
MRGIPFKLRTGDPEGTSVESTEATKSMSVRRMGGETPARDFDRRPEQRKRSLPPDFRPNQLVACTIMVKHPGGFQPMPKAPFSDLLDYLRKVCGAHVADDLTDAELLERFRKQRDETAFSVLVHRHGPMVLGVCRRILGDRHGAEDAFQAAFLVLVRRAGSISRTGSLPAWLQGVAQRVAIRARNQEMAQRQRERQYKPMPTTEPIDDLTWRELRTVLDQEIARLPEKYRAPLVLCHLEGKTYDQAARELGWTKTSLRRRLDEARELLRERLVRRGITMSAGALATVLCEKMSGPAVGAMLTINTVKAAVSMAAGRAVAASCASAQAVAWAEKTFVGIGAIPVKLVAITLAIGVAVGGAGLAGYRALAERQQEAKAVKPETSSVRATVAQKKGPPGTDLFGDPLPKGALARLGTVRFRAGHSADLAFAPDGKTLASTDSSLGGGVCLWDVGTGRRIYRVGVFSRALSVAFSPDGNLLFNGGTLELWEAASGKLAHDLQVPSKPAGTRGTFSPNGKMLAAVGNFSIKKKNIQGSAPALVVWDADTRKVHWTWTPEEHGFQGFDSGIAFSPDSKVVAAALISLSANSEKRGNMIFRAALGSGVQFWDAATGKEMRRFDDGKRVSTVTFSPDGKMLAAGGNEGGVRLLLAETGELIRFLKYDGPQVSRVTFSKDGTMLAATGYGGSIFIWEPQTGRLIRNWRASTGAIHGLAFSPDGKLLAAQDQGSIRIWEAQTGKEKDPSLFHTESPLWLYFSGDGKTLISAGRDQRVLEWDVATARPRNRPLAGPVGTVASGTRTATMAVSPDGSILAQENPVWDEKSPTAICLWDTVSGKEIRTFGQLSNPRALAFSPDGKQLASASAGPTGLNAEKDNKQSKDAEKETTGIHIWDVATGKLIRHIQQDAGSISSITFSSAGNSLLSIDYASYPMFNSASNTRLWDMATGKELQHWENKANSTVEGARVISPDGNSVACVSHDGVRVVSTRTGKEQFGPLRADSPSCSIGILAYSPTGRILAGAESTNTPFSSLLVLRGNETDASCTIHLWDAQSGEEIRKIQVPPESYVKALAFAPDGRTLATSGGDTAILLWDVTSPPKDGAADPNPLGVDQLNGLWSELAGGPVKADEAIWTLARTPQQSGPFLQKRLQLPSVTAEQLAQLLADLDSNQFAVRQKAIQRLEELGDAAAGTLAKALGTPPPLEVRQRIEQILEKGRQRSRPHLARGRRP